MDPDPRESSSEQLARRARAGCRSSFDELVHRHHEALYQFLRLRTRSDELAQELTQDSFVRAWHKIRLYRERFPFTTWLYTIARRLMASRLRRRAHPVVELGEDAVVDAAGNPSRLASARESRRNLWSTAREVLNETELVALWLRYADGFTVEEIGRILRRRRGTVRVMLHRARQKLARSLGEHEAAPARPTATRGVLTPQVEEASG